MKHVIAIAALIFCMGGTMNAQNTQTPEAEAQEHTDKMVRVLKLDDNQKTLIYRQNLERAYQVEKLRKSDMADEDKNGKIREHNKSYEKQIKEILTDDQFSQYQKEKDLHRQEAVKTMKN